MQASPEKLPNERIASIVKAIVDVDDLAQLLRRQLNRGKTWQRQLLAYLEQADLDAQVLRMTISLERPAPELIGAAAKLGSTFRMAEANLQSTRADLTMRQAVRLLVNMSGMLASALEEESSHFAGAS
ncbi:hypothetical protein [Pelomonas sp. KK5]|uniref:hypothetical protein n=1 Tax=Pelomonas sp. KK5 TaxID=1855730 RepID=UPI00097C1BA0|nr:hypothetical protein [Pelomonas sp. KK5]